MLANRTWTTEVPEDFILAPNGSEIRPGMDEAVRVDDYWPVP
jgi:hypothetical protein